MLADFQSNFEPDILITDIRPFMLFGSSVAQPSSKAPPIRSYFCNHGSHEGDEGHEGDDGHGSHEVPKWLWWRLPAAEVVSKANQSRANTAKKTSNAKKASRGAKQSNHSTAQQSSGRSEHGTPNDHKSIKPIPIASHNHTKTIPNRFNKRQSRSKANQSNTRRTEGDKAIVCICLHVELFIYELSICSCSYAV
jgi:hypothetical protein